MKRGRNELLDAVYNDIERADFRAEMIVTVICVIGIILLVVLL